MSDTRTLAQQIGQAENALRAMLEQQLAGSGITYGQWVTLSMIARGKDRLHQEALLRAVGDGLKVDRASAQSDLEALAARGLVAPLDAVAGVAFTADGSRQFQQLRERVGAISKQLYGDLPPADLAATQRVLALVTERANALLEEVR